MPTVELAINAAKATQGADQFSRAIHHSARQARDAQGHFIKAQQSIDTIGDSASKAVTYLKQFAAGLAFGYVANQAVQAMMSFEKIMQTLKGVTRASTEELELFRSSARQLGSTTVFSATDAGDAMLLLAKAGFTASESVTAASGVLDLAAAETLGLADAAQIAVNTIKQFGLAASDATRVADILMEASNASATGATALGGALSYVGTISRSVGIDLENTTAALALLANSGLEGDRAGTGLRGVIESLVNPTGKATSTLERFGITLARDVNPSVVGLQTALQRIKDANLDTQAMFQIFGTVATPAAGALLQNIDAIEPMVARLRQADGAAKALADTVNDSLYGAVQEFKSAVEEAYLRTGDAGMLGALRELVDFTTESILAFIGMGNAIDKNNSYADEFVAVIQHAAVATGAFYAVIGAAKLIQMAQGINVVTAATAAWNAMLALNPIFFVATAIAAAVVALYHFRDSVITIGGQSATVMDYMVAGWEVFVDYFQEGWDAASSFFSETMTLISNLWQDLTKWLSDKWKSFTDWLGVDWSALWEGVVKVMKTAANTVLGTISGIIESVGLVIGRMWALIDAMTQLDFSSIEKFKQTADVVKNTFLSAADPAKQVRDMQEVWSNTYKRDYVSEYLKLGGDLAAKVKEGWNAAGGWEGILKFSRPLMSWAPDYIRDVQNKAAQRKSQRDLLARGPDTGFRMYQQPLYPDVATMFQDPTASSEFVFGSHNGKGAGASGGGTDEAARWAIRNREDSRKQFEDMFEDMRNERDLMFLTNQQRELELQLRQARKLAEEGEVADREVRLKQMEKEFRLLQNYRDLKTIANGIGESFGSAFEDVVFGAQSATEALKGFYESVTRLVFNQMVTQPLAEAISGGLGNFMKGFVTTNATGGVFLPGGGMMPVPGSSDTLFGFGGNRVGSIAETQAEAVIPLTQGPQGLGIRSYGGGGGGGTTVINLNIKTQDADSFRRSKSQIRSMLRGMGS